MKSKKTVKVTTLVMVLILASMLTLSGCGGTDVPENSEVVNETVENNNVVSESDENNNVVSETDENNVENGTEVSENSESVPEWEDFLDNYEDWVDDYVALTKKYKANPTDLTILADYTKMAEELADWQTDADEMKAELENASATELAEYTKELERIVGKLSQVAN